MKSVLWMKSAFCWILPSLLAASAGPAWAGATGVPSEALEKEATTSSVEAPAILRSDVFVAGEGGVHTYRIPAMVQSPGGTLLVFCEARKHRQNDASPTDLVLKRSEDGGRSWLPMQTLMKGTGADAIMNPVAVVDGATRTVFLACCSTNRAERGQHRRHVLLSSCDDGKTWAEVSGFDVTPRRCQKFRAKPGQKFGWTNTAGGTGTIDADDHGLVTIEKVRIEPGRETTLTISVP